MNLSYCVECLTPFQRFEMFYYHKAAQQSAWPPAVNFTFYEW